MMTKLSRAITLAIIGTTCSAAYAEDIDIYTLNSKKTAPNVLFFLDNTSNWASAGDWKYSAALSKCTTGTTVNALCQHYVDKVFHDKKDLAQGQVQVRALQVVLEELACDAKAKFDINIGLMLYNDEGTVDPTHPLTGYIKRAVQPMTPGSAACDPLRSGLIGDLVEIDKKIQGEFKGPSSAEYGLPLFEAFKYFGGYANTKNKAATSPGTPTTEFAFGQARNSRSKSLEDPNAFTDPDARTTYKSPILANSCGNNFIVLIANKFPNQEFGTNQNASPIPTNSVMQRLGLNLSQSSDTGTEKNLIRFADEWSEFLAVTDVSSVNGQQPVKTFTVDVFNGNRPPAEGPPQIALLKSMAKRGGTGEGGYFQVNGDLQALVAAFKDVFTQISAVNSAFASASLPISVNTQGTYLNQVFIGMFRPAKGASGSPPRWAGNLKQYQFQLSTNNIGGTVQRSLYLADADAKAAIDNANTGFLLGCARSFWTKTTDPVDYWKNVTSNLNYYIPEGSCTARDTTLHNDNPDGSIVERGGAAQQLRLIAPEKRKIFKWSGAFSPANDLEYWIRGDNVGDGYNSVPTDPDVERYSKQATEMRPTVHGGVIHSRPLAINYGTTGTDDVVVFYGGDDGLLRAIDGDKSDASGTELWAFLPEEFIPRLQRNRDNAPRVTFFDDPMSPKDYFLDGSLGAYMGPKAADGTGGLVKYLYSSMRRGGRTIYAFDITANPATNAPKPLWRFGCPTSANTDCYGGTAAAKLGQTWSTPRIIRVKGQSALYAVFGAGYDKCEDSDLPDCKEDVTTGKGLTGKGIFVLNASNGNFLRFINFGEIAGDDAGHIVGDVVPVDVDNDGYTDVLYAGDTRGNLWRVNLVDPTLSITQTQDNWITTHVAKIGNWNEPTQRRKFLYAPDVVTIGTYNIVLIGTGNREKPLDSSPAANVINRFYGFWDEYALTSISTPSKFVLIDDGGQPDCDKPGNVTMESSSCQLLNTSTVDPALDYLGVFSDPLRRPRGWVIDLDDTTSSGPNEQVVTSGTTIGGLVNFSTFQAKNPDECSALGTARGYAACFLHGGATCDNTAPLGATRSENFVGGGLPPSPVSGVVEVNGQIVPFIIGGKPNAPGGSALEAKLPSIPIKKDRTKVYRYKKID